MKPSSHKDNTPDIFFTDSSSCVFAVPSFSPPPSTFAALARHSRLSRSARLSACCRSAASRWLSALSAIHCGQLPAGSRLYLLSTVGSFPLAVGSICHPLWAASRWLSALSAIHCGQLPAGCQLYLPSTVGSFLVAVGSICHPLWAASRWQLAPSALHCGQPAGQHAGGVCTPTLLSQFDPHFPFPAAPRVCSPCLCLSSSPENRLISLFF